MTLLAFSRPFWPLFLHVLGAMTLFGAILAAVVTSLAAWSRPQAAVLRTATFWALVSGIPAFVVLRVFAQVLWNDEKDVYPKSATWVSIGFDVADFGVLVYLAAILCAWWWVRSGRPVAGRVVACLAVVFLALLTVALLAMSGKWG